MKKAYDEWTDEERGKRDKRLHRAYLKRLEKSAHRKWSWDASWICTIFGTVKGNTGALLYKNPEEARRVHKHFLEITHILKQNKERGNIHPLFYTVEMHNENSRPVLLRSINGQTLDEIFDSRECRYIWLLIHKYLFPVLTNLGFHDDYFLFDIINWGNIVINKEMRDILLQNNLEKYGAGLEKLTEIENEDILSLFNEWHGKGARIYLFDFGTWFKPYRNEAGEILYYTNKYWNRVIHLK